MRVLKHETVPRGIDGMGDRENMSNGYGGREAVAVVRGEWKWKKYTTK